MDEVDRLSNAIAWVQQFRTGFRRIPLSEKVLIVEKTFSNEFSLSEIARQHGVSPNQLFWWRKLYRSASLVGMKSQGKVHTDNSVRLMEKRISELERLLGRKTREVEILREALAMSKASKVEIEFHPHKGLKMLSPREFRRRNAACGSNTPYYIHDKQQKRPNQALHCI